MTALSILLLGGGGREHALAWKLAQSPRCGRLFAAPGNPGISEHAQLVTLDPNDGAAVAAWAVAHHIDLVVIGPEAPLAAGVSDSCRAAGIQVFGPSKAAAMLEASKGYTKKLCDVARVPTASWAHFTDLDSALTHVRAGPVPVVVKADGLAAGKGVTVAQTLKEAEEALTALFADGPAEVVIEECLAGEEVSFFVLTDGATALPLIAAQDHKRVGDGDTGPNTGGMGAYAPTHIFTRELQDQTMQRIVLPTLSTMAARGTPFQGILFVGLMLTAEGPKLIEYNVRFGDPECQVLMTLLDSDLVDLLEAAATGKLAGNQVEWKDGVALTVVVAAAGYPGKPRAGGRIGNLAEAGKHARIFQAGTSRNDEGHLVASGGRVLAVTANAETTTAAARLAYSACAALDFPDGFYRHDIGHREIAREA
ncbi:MAG: phosphoribosylamine--glycine ligase [Sphingomonadaceae bacterium]